MSGFEALSAIATIGSTVLGAVGNIQQGKAQEAQAEAQAKVDEQRAKAEEAEAGRAAREKQREGLLLQSQQIARAAAQGGASDPSIVSAIADVEAETELQAGRIQAAGEQTAQDIRYGAQLRRDQGKSARRAGYTRAVGTTLSGAASIASQAAKFSKKSSGKSKYG